MSLRQDLAQALRLFAKAPGFTAVAVLVLAIGIGANTAMFSFANELLLRPLWGQGGDLVGVYAKDRTIPDSWRLFSYPNYADLRDAGGVFDSVLAQTYTMVGTPAGDGTRRLLAAVVSSNYFDTLKVRLAAGRGFTPEEERPGARLPVAIATHAAWKQAGFDPSFIGRTISINSTDYTIVGIAPAGFSGTMAMLSPEVFLPLGMFDAVVDDRFKNNGRGLSDRSNHGLSLSGRLARGLTVETASAPLGVLSRQMEAAYPAENRNLALSVNPLSRLSMSPAPQNNVVLATLTSFLMTLSGLVLVIACLNMANMLLARGAARRKEIAVRLALGAGRSRVVRQLLTESFVLASAGAALGLVLAYWAMRAFTASVGAALPFNLALAAAPNPIVLAATVVFTAIGTLAFGLGPALGLSRRDLIADLKDRGADGLPSRRRFNSRNAMVVGQMALSLALLTSGGIFARTTMLAAAGRPGYDYDGLMIARLDTKLAGLAPASAAVAYGDVMSRVRSMPGVTAATLASSVPFGDAIEGRGIERVGGTETARARAFRVIGADYFRALNLRVIRGREFTAAEESSPDAPSVAIVDEVLARRLFGGADPIGQVIRVAREAGETPSAPGEPMEIVGLAPPIRAEILDTAPAPHVYVPFGRHARSGMFVQVRLAPGMDPRAAGDAFRREVRLVNAGLPVLSLSTMQAAHDSSLELLALSTTARVFSGLGLLALLLASIGVYGVRAYLVAQRTREIGIRMALGAAPRDVLRMVVGDGALLTLAGLVTGVPLAVLISIALRSVFVDVGGVDVIVLAVATLTLAIAAGAASAIPARRAARVEPLDALRTE